MTGTEHRQEQVKATRPSWKARAEKAESEAADWEQAASDAMDVCDQRATALAAAELALTEWHDMHHGGSYRFCYDQPCRAVNSATYGIYL